MNFRVIWRPEAEQELTDIWLGSRFRSHVTEAASLIDEKLGRDPDSTGESRDESFRVVFSPPLGVRCYVDDVNRIVIVLSVWQTRRPG